MALTKAREDTLAAALTAADPELLTTALTAAEPNLLETALTEAEVGLYTCTQYKTGLVPGGAAWHCAH